MIRPFFPQKHRNWLQEHESQLLCFHPLSRRKYHKLFQKYIKEMAPTGVAKKLAKEFRGPCYGLCMALLERTFEESEAIGSQLVDRALSYSLVDVVRARMERGELRSGEELRENRLLAPFFENIEPLESETMTPGNSEDADLFLSQVKELLVNRGRSHLLLRVWSRLNFRQVEAKKWVNPHAILIVLDSESDQYYFYDTKIKAIVREQTPDQLADLFADYIRKVRPRYLYPNLIWRFDSYDSGV